MEFVEIGSPGNAADTTGNPNPAGAVSYTFNMGKHEVSRGMVDKANAAGGLGIQMLNMVNYSGNGASRPAVGISWFEAAQYVNWLNESKGFQAAYNFDQDGNFQLWSAGDAWQLDGQNLFRHKDAEYWLPSADEWYKAAYFDPESDTYVNFPTGSNAVPTAVTSGTAPDTAVFSHPLFQGPAKVSEAGGLSAFGVMGMGGNVYEWEETTVNLLNDTLTTSRALRGGGWLSDSSVMSSAERRPAQTHNVYGEVGFRVASRSSVAVVPEPSSLAIWALLGVGGVLWQGRRLHDMGKQVQCAARED